MFSHGFSLLQIVTMRYYHAGDEPEYIKKREVLEYHMNLFSIYRADNFVVHRIGLYEYHVLYRPRILYFTSGVLTAILLLLLIG